MRLSSEIETRIAIPIRAGPFGGCTRVVSPSVSQQVKVTLKLAEENLGGFSRDCLRSSLRTRI